MAALRFAALLLVTLALSASCHRSPTTPSEPPPPQTPPEAVISRIELIAPRTLAPGATAQFRVMANWSDGRTEDITTRAILRTARPDVIAISPDGSLTALKLGESLVTAQLPPRSTSQEVVVVPENTFRVRGSIREADTLNVSIREARVEVDGGLPPVLTDSVGFYQFHGLPAHSRLRITKPGYVTREVTLAISNHHTENITLELAAPRAQVSGTYQLTVEAPPSCRDQLPEALLTRRYTAQITQNGGEVRAALSGANLHGGNNFVTGRVEPTSLVLNFHYSYYYGYAASAVEFIEEGTYLVLSGTVPLTAADTGFAGSFNGSFLTFSTNPRPARVLHRLECTGSGRVVLTR